MAETAEHVYGMDICGEVVEQASSKYASAKLDYLQGSVERLPFQDSSMDVIVSFETIEHVNEEIQTAFLAEIKRVLKSNGTLIMSTPDKAVYTDLVEGHNEYHVKEFYRDEFVAYLKKAFVNVELIYQFPNVGYFLTKEIDHLNVSFTKNRDDRSRYVVAICSNGSISPVQGMEEYTAFSDAMYYKLNRDCHVLEKKILEEKKNAEQFQNQQDREIGKQKEYIEHLEKDIHVQKEYIGHLEGDIHTQKEYIERLESDRDTQKEYIGRLESDRDTQREYVEHLEKDIHTQREYIERLEGDRNVQKEYIEHLEKDIHELKETIENSNVLRRQDD